MGIWDEDRVGIGLDNRVLGKKILALGFKIGSLSCTLNTSDDVLTSILSLPSFLTFPVIVELALLYRIQAGSHRFCIHPTFAVHKPDLDNFHVESRSQAVRLGDSFEPGQGQGYPYHKHIRVTQSSSLRRLEPT